MSWQAIEWVFDHSESRLGHRLVLMAIAKKCDVNGQNSWPTHTTIASMTKLSVREVVRAMDGLVQIGELLITPRKSRKGSRHTYSLPKMASVHDKLSPAKLAPIENEHAKLPNEHAKLADSTRQVGRHNKEEQTLNRPEQTKPGFYAFNPIPREERERQDRMTSARKRKLRNFTTHPLEDWEEPMTPREIEGEVERCKKPIIAVGTYPSSWHISGTRSIPS